MSKRQIDLILQSIEDSKEVHNYDLTFEGIRKFLIIWVVIYATYNGMIAIIQKLNLSNRWYLMEDYYLLYNVSTIVTNFLMIGILLICIKKGTMSLRERRFLKCWVCFPIVMLVQNILVSITPYVNTTVMLQYYDAFPLSLIIQSLSVIFLYSYCRKKEVLMIFFSTILYSIFVFIFKISTQYMVEFNEFYSRLFQLVETLEMYKVIEIVTTILEVIYLRRE